MDLYTTCWTSIPLSTYDPIVLLGLEHQNPKVDLGVAPSGLRLTRE